MRAKIALCAAALLLLFAAERAGAVAAGSPSAGSGVAPSGEVPSDPPPTADEVALSQTAQEIFDIPARLEERYPEAYGGVRALSNDNWIVGVLPGAVGEGDLKSTVRAAEAAAIAKTGRSIHFDFEEVSTTQHRLASVNQELSTELLQQGEIAREGGVGVGIGRQVIVVESTGTDVDGLRARLTQRYPDVEFQVAKAELPQLTADRYADNAPWNGGDQLALSYLGVTQPWCTSGPGAHSSSGAHYLLFAGHCGSAGMWYNTNWGAPQANNPVGPSATSLNQTGFPDVGSIAASSSRYFWQGPSPGVRQTTQGAGTANIGLQVCGQGGATAAYGGTNCGTVDLVNFTQAFCTNPPSCTSSITYVQLFRWSGSASIGGDSGGYISFASPFGYGVVGTMTGGDGANNASWATHIQAHLFLSGWAINTPANP